jgi:hypothetical protein
MESVAEYFSLYLKDLSEKETKKLSETEKVNQTIKSLD